jgi:hypothetical protein
MIPEEALRELIKDVLNGMVDEVGNPQPEPTGIEEQT